MHDRLVHHYFEINLDVLWVTLTDDLPALIQALPDPAIGDDPPSAAP